MNGIERMELSEVGDNFGKAKEDSHLTALEDFDVAAQRRREEGVGGIGAILYRQAGMPALQPRLARLLAVLNSPPLDSLPRAPALYSKLLNEADRCLAGYYGSLRYFHHLLLTYRLEIAAHHPQTGEMESGSNFSPGEIAGPK